MSITSRTTTDSGSREHYFYQLPHERKYHVMLRGPIENTNTRIIVEELRNMIGGLLDDIKDNKCSVVIISGKNGEFCDF